MCYLITQGDTVITQGDTVVTQDDTFITQGDTVITQGDTVITQGDTANITRVIRCTLRTEDDVLVIFGFITTVALYP